MEILSRSSYIPSLCLTDLDLCEYCIYGKHAKSAHKRNLQQQEDVQLDLVHLDVYQIPTRSMGGVEYFITFIDDASCKVWAYPIARKSDALHVFEKWLALVENQLGKKLHCLWTDNGGEYLFNEFQHVCDAHGIKRELTIQHNLTQNGVAKRMNRTIQEKKHNMLSQYHLWDPKSPKIIRSHDVIFNEKKMHKTPIRDVEMHKLTFQDVNPPTHDDRRQVVQAPNVDQMV